MKNLLAILLLFFCAKSFSQITGKAYRVLKISRSSLKYQSVKNDAYVMGQLSALTQQYPREGFWKCYYRLRNNDVLINHKRLHRIYKKRGLPLRRKAKKRVPERVKQSLEQPSQNALIERFNKTCRENVLDAYLFDNLNEVREITQAWVNDYNHMRPHDALGGLSPMIWLTLQTSLYKNTKSLKSI